MSNSKAKFANSLRKSISNEKNKVANEAIITKNVSKNAKEKQVQITSSAVDQKTPLVKPNVNVVEESPSIGATLRPAVDPKSVGSIQNRNTISKNKFVKQSAPNSKNDSKDFFDEHLKQEFKASNHKDPFNWSSGLNSGGYSKVFSTMNEEISTYINNVSTASNIQDITQINIAYFEKIKKLQKEFFEYASNTYLSILKSFGKNEE